MKSISFTDNEYQMLVKLLFIGEWMLNAQSVEPPFEEEAELVKKIYAQCDKFGFSKFFNKYMDGYEIKEENVLDIIPIIGDYVGNDFWPLLVERLAERDVNELRINSKLDSEEVQEAFESISDLYLDIFAENGLKNLRLVEDVEPSQN